MKYEPHPSLGATLDTVIALLSRGEMEILGQIRASSNAIFLVGVAEAENGAELQAGAQALAIYKPRRGERPLWDFPPGTLCQREVAAYVLSRELGWPLVPPTVLRDGPYGPGAVQLYIDADPAANYFTLREERSGDLLPVALFDLLTNNADRKGGHLLLDAQARIWAIDNALTFHTDPKLRTVIWDFAGAPIPQPYLDDLRHLHERLVSDSDLHRCLSELLSGREMSTLVARLVALLESAFFPQPDPNRRNVPWPMV
ncbi:MAG TPA: SCO1664 family protein [Chloroflexi bacterium]|nr:SCO1664 family protein [Chloroflexota bacterium]